MDFLELGQLRQRISQIRIYGYPVYKVTFVISTINSYFLNFHSTFFLAYFLVRNKLCVNPRAFFSCNF